MQYENLILYRNEKISIKKKFYLLMNILVSNRINSFYHNIGFLLFYELQNLAIFFIRKVNVLNPKYIPDSLLLLFEEIVRVKSLFYTQRKIYNIIIYLIAIYISLFSIFFFILFLKININTTYERKFKVLNYLININLYIFQNIFYDFFSSMLCFGKEYNINIPSIKCNQSNNKLVFSISLFSTLFFFCLMTIIKIFEQDNFFLSQSPLKCIITSINLYSQLFSLLNSLSQILINEFHYELFFVWHIINGFILYFYINKRIIYYNQIIGNLISISYFIKFYAALYFSVFHIVSMDHKGLIFIISSILISYILFMISKNLKEKIIKAIPFNELKNKYNILFYLQFLVQLVEKIDDESTKALLSGIIQLHLKECVSKDCVIKSKKKLYLPLNDKWSESNERYKMDEAFLKHFIISNISYFIKNNYEYPELYINISYYYLFEIGNVCMCLFYLEKLSLLKLNLLESFSVNRSKIIISNQLMNFLKKKNEPCYSIKELDTTLYFQYNDISQKFMEKIFKEISLSIEFWNFFSIKHNEYVLNYNDIFYKINEIANIRDNINSLWKKMFEIYSGVNMYFEVYLHFISNVNVDEEKKIFLTNYKKKFNFSIYSSDNIIRNYYNILFNIESGIGLINGNEENEGTIEKTNFRFAQIFDSNPNEIIGKKIQDFMPKIFAIEHKNYMNNYINSGLGKIIDKKPLKVIGVDKNKNLIFLKKIIKIFPMLNHSIIFIGIITKESINDLILIDSFYDIQGMSKYLMEKMKFNNENFFYQKNIPFYLICKNFLNYHKCFLKDKKKDSHFGTILHVSTQEQIHEKIINKNIGVNEEMEVEYEIKIPNFLLKLCSNLIYNNLNNSEFNSDSLNEESDFLLSKKNNNQLQYKNKKKTINFLPALTTKKLINENPIIPTSHLSKNNLKFCDDINSKFTDFVSMNNEDAERKIAFYKKLFIRENYNDIEKLLENDNKNCKISFKFNFTINKYIYGNNSYCFLIRCIFHENEDKKEEDDFVDSINENSPILMLRFMKKRIKFFNKLYEINTIEREKFISNIKDIQKFEIIQNKNKKKITKFSKIFGELNTETENTELSSHSSIFGYKFQLSHIQRINELKAKILKNSSNHKILKLLQFGPIIWIFVSFILIFSLYLFFLYSIKRMKNVRLYSKMIMDIQCRITQILNSLVDLNLIFKNKHLENSNDINLMFKNETLFFFNLKQQGIHWYFETIQLIQNIIKYFNNFIYLNNINIWQKVPISSSNDFPIQFIEHFILSISESLYNAYFLFINENFTNEKINTESEYYKSIEYCNYFSLQSMINFNLPIIINYSKPFIEKLVDYNNNIDHFFDYIIFIIFLVIFILIGSLFMTIFITINKIGTGIYKLGKINQQYVEEAINNLENYSNLYKKKLSFKNESLEFRNPYSYITLDEFKFTKNNKKILDKFLSSTFIDHRRIIHLKIFSHYYILIFVDGLIILSIVIYFCYMIREQINMNKKFLIGLLYIQHSFLYTSTKLLNLKSQFQNITKNPINYNDINNYTLAFTFYELLQDLPEANQFYYIGYLLDFCSSFYNSNSIEYYDCKKDPFLYQYNSTKAINDYLISKIDRLNYEYIESDFYYKENNSFHLFQIDEYFQIIYAYEKVYIPFNDKFSNILELSISNEINKKKHIFFILGLILFIWGLIDILNLYLFFIPYLRKYFIISREFIRIIPINYIIDTPQLFKWMEKINEETF